MLADTVYECSCGDSYESDPVEKLEHEFTEYIDPFTGKTKYRCIHGGYISVGVIEIPLDPVLPPVYPPVVSSYSLRPDEDRTLESTVVQEYTYVYNGGTLMQMVIETTVDDGEPVTETLSFSYDASGLPMSVVYNGTAYFYTVNLQGDVVAIVDSTGVQVVGYTYDAWGKVLSQTGTMAWSLGEENPLRYRGYVYDQETDLYYLQSRYYDPELGRFINADVFVATGQGTLGNNMFVYCTNNPVNFLDPAGTISWAIFGDRHLLNPNMIFDFGGGGRPYANGGVSTHGSSITIKEFLDTDNPEVVFEQLEKYGMSYYNGFPVFQASLGDGRAFSCGIIVLDDYYTYNWAGVVTLNHEYGHRLHMDDIGIINYILTTAAPSLLHAGLSKLGLVKNYYSLPWERVADIYGGVNRNNYVPGSERNAMMFWVYTLLVSELTGGI